MSTFKYLLFISTLALFLSGCAEQVKKTNILVPIEERNSPVTNNELLVKKTEDVKSKARPVLNAQKESVVIALLDEADLLANEGQSEQAAATLERALRIEPRNALLWHRLAVIRLQQQKWQQTIAMARKSNALARGDNLLQSKNWGLMAVAYEKLGDKQKANEARNKQRVQS